MVSLQGILHYLPLVLIWLALPDLATGEPLGRILEKLECVSPPEIFGTPHYQTSDPGYSRTLTSPECYTLLIPQTVKQLVQA